jgi:hypothetical protein
MKKQTTFQIKLKQTQRFCDVRHVLLLIFLITGSYQAMAQRIEYVDMNNWSRTGPGNASWNVEPGGHTVLQTVNGDPTFFVSDQTFGDIIMQGTIKVATTGDDDYIGIVFGFSAPVSTSDNYYNMVMYDWKQNTQSANGYTGQEGHNLSRVDGIFSGSEYWQYFWGHTDTGPGGKFDVLATDYGGTKGWVDNYEHTFRLIYSSTQIKIVIDDVTIFDISGSFPSGKVGFYNFSQAQVRYGNVQISQVGPGQVPPIAMDDHYGVFMNNTLTVNNVNGILANDFDPNLDDFFITQLTDVTNGTLNLNLDDGSFTYIPDAGWTGIDTFTYMLTDNDGDSDPATVFLSVVSSNTEPTDISLSNSVFDNNSPNNTTIGVLTTTDPDPYDWHEYLLIDNGGGRFKVYGDKLKVADSSLMAPGTYSVIIRTTDLFGLFYDESFNIEAVYINDPPTIDTIENPVGILEDAGEQIINFTGVGYGYPDPLQTVFVNAESSDIGIIPDPAVVYSSPDSTGSLNYTPVTNANGIAEITVLVTDDGGTSNGGIDSTQIVFSVEVIAVNDEPLIDNISNPSAIPEDSDEQTILLTGIDDGDPEVIQNLNITAVSSNTNIIPNPIINYVPNENTGSLNYTPVSDANGTVTISVTLTDDGGTNNGGDNSVTISFDVEVTPVNDPPVADAGEDQIVNSEETVTLDGSGSYDIDSESFTFHWSSPPEIFLSDSTLVDPTFTAPVSCVSTDYVFSLIVNDGEYNSNPDSVIVTVLPAPPDIIVYPELLTENLLSGTNSIQTLTVKNEGFCDLIFTATPQADWLSITSKSETIVAGDSLVLNVLIDAANLYAGIYDSEITIESNDPDEPVINVPVTLTVTGEPEMLLSETSFDFGNVFIGQNNELNLNVANAGTDNLIVTEILSSDPDFDAIPGNFSIAPENSQDVTLSFNPTVSRDYNEYLVINSNNPAKSTDTIFVFGTGVEPPVIYYSPASFTLTLNAGQSEYGLLQIGNIGNTGAQNLIYSIEINELWLSSSPTEGVVQIGDTMNIYVNLDATDLIEDIYDGTIIIHSNDPVNPLIEIPVELTVIGEAEMTLSADTLDFPEVNLGSSSTDVLTIYNEGTANLNITNIEADNIDFYSDLTNFTVTPAGSQNFNITFQPSDVGDVSATLSITFDSNEISTIALSGTGIDPQIDLPVTNIDFGSVNVGFTGSDVLTINSIGQTELIITDIIIDDPVHFTYNESLPIVIDGVTKVSFDLGLNFIPTNAQDYSAILTLVTNAGDFDITLDGTGIASDLVVSPNTLNFGNVVIGNSVTLNLILTNEGNLPLTIDSLYSVPPFEVDPNYNTVLNENESLIVPVTFTAGALIFYNEVLTIVTDDGDFDVALHAVGKNPEPSWQWNWDFHSFGLTDIATGDSLILIVTNTGNVPFVMDDWHVADDHFTVSETTFTLGVGESKQIWVAFYPSDIIEYQGVINYTSNDIGTKEIICEGRGYYLSDAPHLTYVEDVLFNGTSGVYPLLGSTNTIFEYTINYTDADNHAPLAGYPVLGIDKNDDGDFLDGDEGLLPMTEVDPTDTDYTDGKLYSYSTTLPLNPKYGYAFMVYDELGNIGIDEGTNYVADKPEISNDFLDLSIFANDITFSDFNPEPNQTITIFSTIHNNSDYPANEVNVRFYEEDSLIGEFVIPYLSPQSQTTLSMEHYFPIDQFYPMKVVIDEENIIPEDNEMNNFAIRPVIVGNFSIPGEMIATINVSPSSVCPYSQVHIYGHADYVGSFDPTTKVTGAEVIIHIPSVGFSTTVYTDSNGDYSYWWNAPGSLGNYSVYANITDFTLSTVTPSVTLTVNSCGGGGGGGGGGGYVDKPDLYVSPLIWPSQCKIINDSIPVTANYGNIGTATAYNVYVYVKQDASLIKVLHYDSIPVGVGYTISYKVAYANVGSHSTSVTIDPSNIVDELREWNNSAGSSRYIYPYEPDLIPTNILFNDNTPLVGQQINMTFKVNNLNCSSSDDVIVYIYDTYDEVQTQIGTLQLETISGLNHRYLYIYGHIFAEAGTHVITIHVDPNNTLLESNEDNQILSTTINVAQPIADLVISDISFSSYNPDINDLINFTATVWNNGTAAANDFNVRFYIDGVIIDTPILINELQPGVNVLITSDVWGVLDCPHVVSVTVDEENIIPESIEYNNHTSRIIGTDFSVGLWPYYSNSASNPLNILVGSTVMLHSRIYNNGTLDADEVPVSYILDGNMIGLDVLPRIYHELYASSQIYQTFNQTGDFVVQICSDLVYPDSTRFCEINESNNCNNLYIRVYGELPDLEILSYHISPTELNPDPDEPIDIFASFTNNGNVNTDPFWVKFLVNSQLLGDSIYISGLLAHEDSTVACTQSYSSPFIGTHIIRVVLDDYNLVPEYNEMNNEASRAIIVGDAPDLAFVEGNEIWLSNESPYTGELITIYGTVENNGGAGATATVNFYLISESDTIFINSEQVNLSPSQVEEVSIQWYAEVPAGTIYAEIAGSDPPEFNTWNNSATHDFGGSIQIVSPIADINIDEDTYDYIVADLDDVFQNIDATQLIYEVENPEANVVIDVTADNVLMITSLTENWNGDCTIMITASNIYGNSVFDEVAVIVNPVNDPPVANAGEDQRMPEERPVQLDGSASFDVEGDNLFYSWTAPAEIVLSDTTIVNPTFIAPEVDVETQFTISLYVNDGEYDSEIDDVVISVFPVEDQDYELHLGYQLVSSRIIPLTPDMLDILEGNLDYLDFVRNSDGYMLTKVGPNWINNIGDWITIEGYLFRMIGNDYLTITGEVINPQTPIALSAGYQMISYLPDYLINALVSFTNVLGNLEFVRNTDGYMLRKIGPVWVNSIGDMLPGEGYLVKMYSPDVLTYPEESKSPIISNIAKPEHFIVKDGNPSDPVWTINFEQQAFETGDEIAVFDGEKLVGSGVINSDNIFENSVPVFSNLYISGNIPIIKVWNKIENKESVLCDYTFSNPYGDAWTKDVFPAEDGEYSLLHFSTTGIVDNNSLNPSFTIYPNPSEGIFNISIEGVNGDIQMKIIDVHGNNYRFFEIEGIKSITTKQLDLKELPAGVYFISFSGKDFSQVKKIVIQ